MTPTNRTLTSIILPLILVFFGIGATAVYFVTEMGRKQEWVFHTYTVIDDSKSLWNSVQGAESSQRGYLITRSDEFLGSYHRYLTYVGRYLGKLKADTSDNPEQQKRLRDMEALINKKLDILARAIELQQQVNPEAAAALIGAGDGIKAMEDLRQHLLEFVKTERSLLSERRDTAQTVKEKTATTLFAGAAVALITLLGIAIVLARNNYKLALAEKNLAAEAILLQGTLDNIRDGIAAFDANGMLRAFNIRFFELLEFPGELAREGAMIGNFQDIDQHRNHPIFSQLPRVGEGSLDKYQRISLNHREMDVYRNPLQDGGFLIGAIDVTEQVRAENINRQAQKMEAIGHLTGGVAHDFNNLLQIISANLDLLAKDVTGNPKSAERLQNAISGVERGSRLTQQLLAFARRQPLDPRPVNLGRLIHEMTELLRRTLGERVDVEAVISGGLWNTSVDPVQVENSILNLAINARDSMPDGGKVTIEISNAVLDDAYSIEHQEVVPGQYVMLAVSDTGAGMSPEIIARAFEPFFTTKPEGRGTGLGLSQVYGFVKQSGGHVKVYSEIDHGTTVKIYLPRAKKTQDVTETSRESPISGGSETILVVEDDAGVRAAVTDLLKDLGYSVLKAENADEALALLESGARPDLLFTDVVMPGQINTREFARMAKVICPDMSVLFTSGYTQNAIVHNGKLDDDVFLLSKPYRKNDLARKVRSVLDMPLMAFNAPPPVDPQQAAPEPLIDAVSLKKILIVEDEPLVRMSTVDMIEQLNHEVEETDNAESALEILKGDDGIGILITDLGLHGMSGEELVQRVQTLRPDVKIIVASGYDNGGDKIQGEIVYLTKPFQLGDLKRAIAQAMAAGA